MNLAGLDFEHINTQIAAQEIRVKMANQDIASQQQLIDNANEVSEFLKNKYTTDELYTWLEGSMRTSMYQTYLLAYDLAKKAEQAFRFERRPTPAQQALNFISFGYFDPACDGLQASSQLYLALKQMEVAYQDSRGHYFRRIKTVSVTVPCVVGPHVGVYAFLRLLKHRYRVDSLAASARDYVEDTSGGAMDPRFRTAFVPIDAVAVGSAQNDAGSFELNIRDERYLSLKGWVLCRPGRLPSHPLLFVRSTTRLFRTWCCSCGTRPAKAEIACAARPRSTSGSGWPVKNQACWHYGMCGLSLRPSGLSLRLRQQVMEAAPSYCASCSTGFQALWQDETPPW